MNRQAALNRAGYVLWALGQAIRDRDLSCPGCGSPSTVLVRRKYIVTALRGCADCELMFRTPKGDPMDLRLFYDTAYQQGLVTDAPSSDDLRDLVDREFRGSTKDFTEYIRVLEAAGLKHGATLLDFGSSWGYGSWQFRKAGYRVTSYELSPSRAKFAADQLDCDLVTGEASIPPGMDCFFAAHVIEHLPNPRLIWELAARVVSPDGIVILFLPNGDPKRADLPEANYHKLWGRVHPMLISPAALVSMAAAHGFTGSAYTSPYNMNEIRSRDVGSTTGDELLFVARRARVEDGLARGVDGGR